VEPQILALEGAVPSVATDAWVAPGATLVGAVTLEARASVWYGTVLRADNDRVVVGERSNVQDCCVAHADPGYPVTLGADVSVGHRATLHGCTVEDECLVGMGATLLNGVVVGTGSIVAAGAVLLEGTVVPPGSLVAGVPGKVRREVTDDEVEGIRGNARSYLHHVTEHLPVRGLGADGG
jgi:carbonic anhydrase/acetyltransferase-like protein (isoleucine patch superfamily)